MKPTLSTSIILLLLTLLITSSSKAQDDRTDEQHTLYDIAPRKLIDLPTAGTLPRGFFNIGLRLFTDGGALGFTDIGLSHRFTIGISFGGTKVVSNHSPSWNPKIGFSLKFRVIDELEYFPGIAVGFTDQGYGKYLDDTPVPNSNNKYKRYTYKSRGFYAVASRSFYFYKWTSGWHFGLNYTTEDKGDSDNDITFFGGFDATFNYNLALLLEYDAALNDDRSGHPKVAGKGRGYLNASIKWLFARDLELEFIVKDLLINRRESSTVTREVRILYVDSF